MSAAGPGPERRLRRGLGWLYLLSGAVHAGIMALAVLYAEGRLPWLIPAAAWSRLYFLHFTVTAGGGGLYLLLSYRREGLFYPENLLDYAVGIAAFMVVMTASAALLVARVLPSWAAFLQSAFLLAYGAGLLSGRRMGFGRRG